MAQHLQENASLLLSFLQCHENFSRQSCNLELLLQLLLEPTAAAGAAAGLGGAASGVAGAASGPSLLELLLQEQLLALLELLLAQLELVSFFSRLKKVAVHAQHLCVIFTHKLEGNIPG